MRARKRTNEGEAIEPKRVYKRKPRSGPRRGMNLMLCAELATRLELRAVRELTTPSEIVMDWIEAAGRRGRGGDSAEEAAEDAA